MLQTRLTSHRIPTQSIRLSSCRSSPVPGCQAGEIFSVYNFPIGNIGQRGRRLGGPVGIATLPEDAQDRETLLFIADQALFGSKGRGRDRIMLARDLVAESEDWHSPGQPA